MIFASSIYFPAHFITSFFFRAESNSTVYELHFHCSFSIWRTSKLSPFASSCEFRVSYNWICWQGHFYSWPHLVGSQSSKMDPLHWPFWLERPWRQRNRIKARILYESRFFRSFHLNQKVWYDANGSMVEFSYMATYFWR